MPTHTPNHPFINSPIPPDEAERQARLRELLVLDSEPEPAFDAIALLVSQACDTPMAMIVLIDGDRQWFKATVGIGDIRETPRDMAFCAHTILSDELLVVPDLADDPRFAEHPFVVGFPQARFYAGAPLIMPGGERVGTLCVLGQQPGALQARQTHMLRSLAGIVTQTLVLRRDLITKALSVRTDYERVLTHAADEMADLYDNAPCGYHSLDANGRFVRINNAALRMLGYSREEVIGRMAMTDFLTEEGRALFARHFPALMTDGKLDDLEFDLVSRSGEVRRVIVNATTIKSAEGLAVATRTVTYDITELRHTRDALRQLTAEQQAVLDTDLIGIMRVRDRVVTWANRGAERLFGYAPGELVNQPNRNLYADEATYQYGGEIAYREMPAGKVFSMHVRGVRKDGEPIWVDVRGTASPDDPRNVLCMVVDITAAKRAEEDRVRAQTLEAENRQLAEIGRVKGVFLSNMSHELRTPLNAVLGYAHLLQAGTVPPDSPKFQHYLGQIGSSGRQLLGLIDTVLNFTEVESGALVFRPEPVRLKPLLQNVIESLRNESLKKGAFLSLEVDAGLQEVVTDELRLNQVVSIYVSNAIKFSPEGGSVTLRAWTENDSRFRIEVEDSGIGIAQADLPRLFTPFQQLSEGSVKDFSGAGLGLALTRRLVEAQGGSVGVHSSQGVGSVFWLALPRNAALTPA